MTKTIINYSNTIIYKIVCNDLTIEEKYVGSTTNFRQRKSCHKSTCNNENSKKYNYKIYQFIRNNGGWENWCMIEIEKYPCEDGNETRSRERFWIEELKCKLNIIVPTRSKKEHYEANAEKIKENKKTYQQENADKIKEYKKTYQQENADKIKENRKEYYQENKEKIKEQFKEYYQEKTEWFKEYQKEYHQKNADKIKEYKKLYYQNKKTKKII